MRYPANRPLQLRYTDVDPGDGALRRVEPIRSTMAAAERNHMTDGSTRPRAPLAARALLVAISVGVAYLQTVWQPPEGAADEPRTVALGLYQTVFPDDMSAVRDFGSRTGHKLSIVHWYALWGGWKSQFNISDLQAVNAAGAIPMITWEPWTGTGVDPAWSLRAAILSGAHDDYIDSWARGLSAYGGPVLFRFAHEMNDQRNYPWAVGVNGNTAADYIAAWHYIRAIFARYPTSNVKWVWSPQTLGDSPQATYEAHFRSVYPGDDLVDWLGLDVYNTGPNLDWGAPRWRSFREVLATPYAAITAIANKPVILAEVGSSENGGSKADWISSALTTELPAFPLVGALVWFDIAKEDAWGLRSSPAAFAAWTAAASFRQFKLNSWSP